MTTTVSQYIDSRLPIAAVADQVCDALRQGNVVLQAEPGAGKSTGLPLALLHAGYKGKILMLEPRRLAAINVATRLASQLDEPLGKTVGLRMRGRTEVSKNTRIEVVTEGVLTRLLQSDPSLEGVAVVVFDEFHERSLNADLGLALCLDVQQGLREDLRLLLMSATLDGRLLCDHLGIDNPIVCTVRQHPVEIVWEGESRAQIHLAAASATIKALAVQDGDILVFLPGVSEIEKTARLLDNQLSTGVVLHRLHSGVSGDAQRAATATKNKDRRVILSTSIAETSITIDGVKVVVDAGLERRSRIDASTGAERLETVMASQASATQRAGRAGRTEPGVCYRLWSESSHSRRAASWQPEILRGELSSLLLDTGQWGADVFSLPWIDAPPEASVRRSIELLKELNIWKSAGIKDQGLSEHGRAVARLPVHPRIGHMLLWACKHKAAGSACHLAALLEDKPRSHGVDLSGLLQQQSRSRSRRADQLKKQLSNAMADALDRPGYAVLLARAFPDRIAKRRAGSDARYLLGGGAGVMMSNDDALAQCEWLVVAELGGASKEARIFAAMQIQESELRQWCADLITSCDRIDWDDRSERVIAERQLRLGSIILESKPLQTIDPQQRAIALMAGVRRKGLACLDWSEDALEWQARVCRLRTLEGDDSTFPAVDDDSLLRSLEHWLQPFAANVSSLKALSRMDLMPVLAAMIDYSQQQKLELWLPRRYTVPSGAQHKLRYACKGNPVLGVKLQEMFGCRENPAVAQGRLPLKIELLSPARRPVQITEDLANFWHNSYPAVKKDLAGRYPKHPWPDDPLQAQATARAKPRKK